ncbi:MAG: FG-GAP-like repeat-containing protein [Verrucomicrobiota bacterium]
MKAKRFPYVSVIALFAWSPVEARLNDASQESGIDYIHAIEAEVPTIQELGLERETVTIVSNHAGAAAADLNGDGWTDFIAARYQKAPAIYINQGEGNFAEEGLERGMENATDAAAFGIGDLDNDGDQDIFAVPHYGERFFLLINDGSGVFTEEAVARNAALEASLDLHEGYSVSLVDYDLDGYLDVYVNEWGPESEDERALHSVLLRNEGESNPARFENVTQAAGLLQPASGQGSQRGFSSAWADFDGDGWPDLYLVADFSSSRMYWNNGDGTFTDGTEAAGLGTEEFGMGVAVADYDRDGDLDIYASSIYDEAIFLADGTNNGNRMYRNVGDRRFIEVSEESGVRRTGWGWGAAFFDYENDGDADLIVTNGSDSAAWGIGSPNEVPHLAALDDQTVLFQNDGFGGFVETSAFSGVVDKGLGKAVVVLDMENDGDEDVIVTQTFASPVVYRNDASENGNDWIRFRFQGTLSNRDGVGAIVELIEDERLQTALYSPTNAYIGQREPFLHFGLGVSDGSVDTVLVKWPSGAIQELSDLSANQVHTVVEPDIALLPPVFSSDLEGGVFDFGEAFALRVELAGGPAASFVWEKDGEVIEGARGPVFYQERFQPFDIGTYRVTAQNANGETMSSEVVVGTSSSLEGKSVARLWNEFLLEAIRKDFPDPTIHSRNLYHVSAAMWDAYWACQTDAWESVYPVFVKEFAAIEGLSGDALLEFRKEAVSHAAYRVLTHRYAESPGKERSLYGFRWLMEQLGFDPDNQNQSGSSAAALGNRVGFLTIEKALLDGSNEGNGYLDTSAYQAVNEAMVFGLSGTELADPNRWQPLAFDYLVTQNGIPIGQSVQTFLGVNWREVDTFALPKASSNAISFDPGPPPLWGTESEQAYIESALEVIRYSSLLDPSQSERIDISPGGRLNNDLGQNDGAGHEINPFTETAYEENWVKHADYGRILAEFWADGPSSETPPGHWNALYNEISDHPLFARKYAGVGKVLSPLEYDIRAYLALNGAMHDAAVAAWTLKRQYDYIRPVSIIRYLGGLGQSSDPNLESYHPRGLPLEAGLVELVTEESVALGERHEYLSDHIGKIALYCWAGEPSDHESEYGGVDWILAENWMPYQRSTFVTPAFAAYVSGHSTFSRAAAEVLSLLTGSPFFPGGLGEFRFEGGEYLEFEYGPSEDVVLQWATYYDAADQAGLSRLYGGIHVAADDVVGRILGARVGVEAFLKASALGGISSADSPLDFISHEQRLIGGRKLSLSRVIYSTQSEGVLSISRPFDEALFLADPFANSGGVYCFGEEGLIRNYIVGEGVRGIEASGYVDGTDESFEIEFEVRGAALNVFIMRGSEASDEIYKGVKLLSDPVLILSRRTVDGSWEEIDRNDDWLRHSSASLSETVGLRESMRPFPKEGKEAALVRQLSAGYYRLRLEAPEGEEGLATLELRASVYEEVDL